MPKTDPTVIIADDHPLFRVTLRLVVRGIAPQARIVEADSFDSLKNAMVSNPQADLVLLDLVMPGVEGLSALQFLRSDFPDLRVAVISSLSQRSLLDSIRALGAAAFIHKSVMPEQLRTALRSLLAGADWWAQSSPAPLHQLGDGVIGLPAQTWSRQQMRILLYLEEGLLNKRIAEDLNLSESAVRDDLGAILHRLGQNHSTSAELRAQQPSISRV